VIVIAIIMLPPPPLLPPLPRHWQQWLQRQQRVCRVAGQTLLISQQLTADAVCEDEVVGTTLWSCMFGRSSAAVSQQDDASNDAPLASSSYN
jgi:hypothetical protein